jgi:hypothetical protein
VVVSRLSEDGDLRTFCKVVAVLLLLFTILTVTIAMVVP